MSIQDTLKRLEREIFERDQIIAEFREQSTRYKAALDRIQELEAEKVPDGYVLVQQSIHPLDCDNGEKVVQLLANTPDAGPFDNPQDFYQFWWQQLLFAAAPAQEKEKEN